MTVILHALIPGGWALVLNAASPVAAQQALSPLAFTFETAPVAVAAPCLDTSTSAPSTNPPARRTTATSLATGGGTSRTNAFAATPAPVCASPRPASETTPPSRGSGCFVDFSDEDALAFQNGAPDGFASFYSQQCGADWFSVWPLNYGHFHLSYENEDGLACYITPDTCEIPDFDPLLEPRYVTSHDGSQYWLLTHQQGDGVELPFGINSLRVMGASVRLCYRPDQDYDPSEWEAGSSTGVGGTPGVWYCWNSLPPGHWDLSEWVQSVTEVKITGIGLPPFSIDDVDVVTQ